MASTNDDEAAARRMTREPGAYALSGKIMLSAIVILFAVVVFMVLLHLYARWYLVHLRRRQIERRRQRRGTRSHAVLYADGVLPVGRGLEVAVLNSLPVFLHTSAAAAEQLRSSECSVCLSEFEEKEIVRLLPKCNHRFHLQCIDMWFLSNATCPLCRSPVEKVTDTAEPAVKQLEPVEKSSLSEPSTSSAPGFCDTCQLGSCGATSFGGQRKDVEVRIEVPQRRAESVLELTQSSPASRLLSFKRILSIGKRSPVAATTPRGADVSGGVNELDLESGTSESNREPGGVHTAS